MRKLTLPSEIKKEKPDLLFRFLDPIGELKKSLDFYIKFVIVILVATVVTLIVMVATLVIDSFHINSVIYGEYSNKVEARDDLVEINQQLRDQNAILFETNQRNAALIQELNRTLEALH